MPHVVGVQSYGELVALTHKLPPLPYFTMMTCQSLRMDCETEAAEGATSAR
jgi:hypothetical protein